MLFELSNSWLIPDVILRSSIIVLLKSLLDLSLSAANWQRWFVFMKCVLMYVNIII